MANKSIAIIGSNSFIASYVLTELVKDNYQLHLYGRREIKPNATSTFTYFNYPDAPIDFKDLMDKDVIIYTAGAGYQSNIPTTSEMVYYVNAFLPINLVQYLQDNEYKGHVITFGSYFEIGDCQVKKSHTEEEYIASSNALPNNYPISKRLLSQYIFQKLKGIPFTLSHLVLPNIYGVGENKTRIIPYLVDCIKNLKPIHLSSCTQQRQFLHARDVAQFIHIIIEKPKTGIYNLADASVLSIKEVVNMVLDQAPDRALLDVNFGSISTRDAGMQYLALDTNKVLREYNWKPRVSLPEGIQEYYNE